MCEFVNMCESKKKKGEFYTSLFLYVAFKRSNHRLDGTGVTAQDDRLDPTTPHPPAHTLTSTPFLWGTTVPPQSSVLI